MISAANSDGDEKGFLNLREFKYHTVKVTLGDKFETVYLTRGFPYGEPRWEEYFNVEPLDTRGWTLQEEYLATRNIRFCTTQMAWRCRRSFCLESPSNSARRDVLHFSGKKSWNKITQEFSKRTLTYDTDKLPACKDNHFFCSSTLYPICVFWVLIRRLA
jgi:hypothetical protein